MAPLAARKARQVAINTARVLACEVVCAAQGLEFHRPLRPGKGALAQGDRIPFYHFVNLGQIATR